MLFSASDSKLTVFFLSGKANFRFIKKIKYRLYFKEHNKIVRFDKKIKKKKQTKKSSFYS